MPKAGYLAGANSVRQPQGQYQLSAVQPQQHHWLDATIQIVSDTLIQMQCVPAILLQRVLMLTAQLEVLLVWCMAAAAKVVVQCVGGGCAALWQSSSSSAQAFGLSGICPRSQSINSWSI